MVIPGTQSPHMTLSSLAVYTTAYDKTTSKSKSISTTTCNNLVSLSWSKDENNASVLQSDVKVDPICTLSSEPFYEELREEQHNQPVVPICTLQEMLLDEYKLDYSIWLQTKDSIEKVKNDEYVEIQDNITLIKELALAQTKQKRTFCNNMYELNQELYHLLVQKESIRLQPLITMETIPIIVDHFNTNCTHVCDSLLTSTSQESILLSSNHDSSTKPPVSNNCFEKQQFNIALKKMNVAELEHKLIREELNLVKQLVEDYRNEFILQNKESFINDSDILSNEKLVRMEDSWKNEKNHLTKTEKKNDKTFLIMK